jgi:glycosyltransferase involved in cell wall biosynthesis
MRIVYILTSLGIGGAEKQVIDLANRMSAKGQTVSLLVLTHTAEEWPVKLPVLRLNLRKTPLGIFRGLGFARGFVVLMQPDILHSHTFPANLFTRVLNLTLFYNRFRVIVFNTIHNVHEGGWHRMLLYRLTNAMCDQVTAVSAAAAERFTRLGMVSASKMLTITNGIDTQVFMPDRSRRRQFRSRMRISKEFVWLAIGRLAPAKDYPNLLRAFSRIRVANPSARLWIAGEGDPTPLMESPMATDIEFLGLRRNIEELLDAADGYVLSSAWEGLPLALGEAMSMGKVVVATDVGGVRELVGPAGFLAPPHDADSLAHLMLRAMSLDEKERRAMGGEARKRVQFLFSMNTKAEEWERLYSSYVQAAP